MKRSLPARPLLSWALCAAIVGGLTTDAVARSSFQANRNGALQSLSSGWKRLSGAVKQKLRQRRYQRRRAHAKQRDYKRYKLFLSEVETRDPGLAHLMRSRIGKLYADPSWTKAAKSTLRAGVLSVGATAFSAALMAPGTPTIKGLCYLGAACLAGFETARAGYNSLKGMRGDWAKVARKEVRRYRRELASEVIGETPAASPDRAAKRQAVLKEAWVAANRQMSRRR